MDYVENPYDATRQHQQWKGWEWGACDALLGYKLTHVATGRKINELSALRRGYIKGFVMMKLHMGLVA